MQLAFEGTSKMNPSRIDLYLGGDLGSWVLDRVDAASIGTVVTTEGALATIAKDRGMTVSAEAPALEEGKTRVVALSVHYPKILPAEVLGRYEVAYNLHPGYLPWGRGFYPVFWAMHDGTPAGATLHQMTERLDGGPIVEQIDVAYSDADTGGSLHQRVREAEKELFQRYWPKLCAGETLSTRRQEAGGSYHPRGAFFEMKRPANWMRLDGEALVKRIRCLTFPGYTGLELPVSGRLVHLTLQDVN
jgi:methionyl-tRNA formyltransferase